MGSKTPPLNMPVPGVPDEDILGRAATLKVSQHNQLLERIADVLQVPKAVLYSPSNAVKPARHADGDGVADLDRDCAALLLAFRRINDPEERQRFLTLVRLVAERT